jgi:exodeoxyribonuclease VII small subunit
MPPKTKPATDESLTFDQAMTQAEELLAQMESGEMELEDALKAYERGMGLLTRCKTVLSQAQQRVEAISALAKGGAKEARGDAGGDGVKGEDEGDGDDEA